jgi:hypothetical protein
VVVGTDRRVRAPEFVDLEFGGTLVSVRCSDGSSQSAADPKHRQPPLSLAKGASPHLGWNYTGEYLLPPGLSAEGEDLRSWRGDPS